MLFNSLEFPVFFALVLVLNRLLRGSPTLQKLMLLCASYYFYGQWSWIYLALIVASTLTDYAIGLGLVKVRNPRRLMIVSLLVNLGFLAFFKYANWLIANWNGAAALAGSALTIQPLDILLPVGISFYTFQSLSYTIDVYRGVAPPRRNLLDYALFVAFWPQLVAGPILRDTEFFAQLDGDKRVDAARVQRGMALMLFGFLKKVVLADNLALYVDTVYRAGAQPGAWDALCATYAFAFQIYFDFSGYTDIAIGAALLLGFEFPPNFAHPYGAQSIQDFWRRWHMTLSRWLRDYLYVSLGGNRKGPGRTYVNLMLTMLLGGLWHGANWTYVVWGGLHGAYLAFERAFLSRWRWWQREHWAMGVLRTLVTFHLVCLAWVFFRASDLASAGAILHAIAELPRQAPDLVQLRILAALAALFLVHQLSARYDWHGKVAESRGPAFVATATAVLLALILLTPAHTVPFIYFQF
jgi:alginate O-acetyltransferase complex protein AlgI